MAKKGAAKMAKKDAKQDERWVVVATAARPWLVVFGRLAARQAADGSLTLTDARCAVYFSRESRSLFGLASRGPGSGSRISERCASVELRSVEAILDTTPEAIAAWERGEWAS